MSAKFWKGHSIKGQTGAAHDHVYGPSNKAAANSKETNDGDEHPGFKAVQGKVEKEGYNKEAAGAIVANAARKASPAAKAANPNLKKVKG